MIIKKWGYNCRSERNFKVKSSNIYNTTGTTCGTSVILSIGRDIGYRRIVCRIIIWQKLFQHLSFRTISIPTKQTNKRVAKPHT